QPLLAAVVAHHHRRVDAGVGGDGTDGGAFITVGGEARACRGEDDGFGLRSRAPHDPSVGQRLLTTVASRPSLRSTNVGKRALAREASCGTPPPWWSGPGRSG